MPDGLRKTAHIMTISPQRVFYAGLLGRPRRRTSGAFLIYVCLDGALTLTRDGRTLGGLELACVEPHAEHTIACDRPAIVCLMIEPETVEPSGLAALTTRLAADPASAARRVRAAYAELARKRGGAQVAADAFDRLFLGMPLPARRIDPRIARAAARLEGFSGPEPTAADCAAEAGLSQSRFLHLFKDETGVSFRSFRAWKRARHLLHFVDSDTNFAHLAQDIGYPDSTHFSHSIRRYYGLKPSAIFTGSRDLRIYRHGALAGA